MQHNNNDAILVSDNDVTQTTQHVKPNQREGNTQWSTIGWGELWYATFIFKTG